MRLLQNQGHPLLSRILLGVNDQIHQAESQVPALPPLPPPLPSPPVPPLPVNPLAPAVPQLPQLPLRPGLLSGPLVPLAQRFLGTGARRKKHAKRATKSEEVFLTPTPKPYESLDVKPTTTKRPRLIERYRALSSVEKAEKVTKVLEKFMHGVTIAGHVDGYLTNRAKGAVKKIHKLFKTSEEQ